MSKWYLKCSYNTSLVSGFNTGGNEKYLLFFFTSYYDTIDIGLKCPPTIFGTIQTPHPTSTYKTRHPSNHKYHHLTTPTAISLFSFSSPINAATKRMQHTGPPIVVGQEANNNNAAFRGRERELHRFCGALKVRKIVFLYVKTVSPPVMWWCYCGLPRDCS